MKVFLSHLSTNKDLVRKISDELKKWDMDLWDDTYEIYPGDNWAQVTSQALEESQAMIVLLTPESLDSKWINWAIDFALSNAAYKHRLIPVLVGDPNSFEREKIPWIFKHLKVVTLTDNGKNDEDIRQIAEALKQAA